MDLIMPENGITRVTNLSFLSVPNTANRNMVGFDVAPFEKQPATTGQEARRIIRNYRPNKVEVIHSVHITSLLFVILW